MNRIFALVGAFALTALLSACVIQSADLLVSDNEATTPLPASIALFNYSDDPEGYTRSDDAATMLTLQGKAYTSADGELAVRFVPLDQANAYLLAATGDDNTIYGLAHYEESILELQVVLGSNVEAAVAAAGLTDATVADGGITVTTRDGVDAAIGLIQAGKLDAGSLVLFVGESADAAAPAKLVRDGERLKPKS